MNISEFLKNNILYLDGGMGTMLQAAGLKKGERPEIWNITHPSEVIAVHKAYYDAGSNVISSNTFGVNTLVYDDEKLNELIEKAYMNCDEARKCSSSEQEKFIAFDIGPLGKLLKPYGDLEFEAAVRIFSDAVNAAKKHPFDLILIETMNDSYETKAALLACKENCDLPVFVLNAYSEDGRLLTGASAQVMAVMLESMGASAIGANCSFGPDKTLPVIEEILKNTSLPVIMKPNAGLPSFVDGDAVYNVSPSDFADSVKAAVKKGVRIVGGCCGTTPEYISSLAEKTKDCEPLIRSDTPVTCVTSNIKAVSFSDKPVLIGERINPTGKKRFRQALLENDIDYIVSEGVKQQEKGAHILDVNVGLAGIDEADMLEKVVLELQSVTDLPLQLDSSDTVALERAMRIYNGKPLVNSVNGKKESMNAVFPLIKKYGGTVIALTLDENGIPDTVEGRLEIAEKILSVAGEYGISKDEIIFDPLTMAISTDKNSAAITLKCIEEITNQLGCKTSLGVSNISFGLPQREKLNSSFFYSAISKGLSAAIMNPFSEGMMNAYYTFCALNGFDDGFSSYISYCDEKNETEISAEEKTVELYDAILKGRAELAAKIAKENLGSIETLSVINEQIIPALDKTGTDYQNGKLYLPQLLMSAEAAGAAFEAILSQNTVPTQKKCKILLATVEGDIHDIGKNIVKLLLENYGFVVLDLGKDVPPERILRCAEEENVSIVGLSALMTTTLDSMKKTVLLLKERLPMCRVVVGGAVVNEEFASAVGADKYAADAMDTVRFAEAVFSE